MNNDKEKLNNYLKNFFEDWLIKDIEEIKKYDDLEFTLPYILLICSGIDFLGGLICGFNTNNSPRRFAKFLKKWMGEVNPLYREDYMAEFLYNNVRNGASHYAMYKKYVSCSSKKKVYPPEKHLYVDIRPNNDNRIIIQVFQFIDDFIKAYNNFKENYLNIHYKNAYRKLKLMLKNDKKSENLINDLQLKGIKYDRHAIIQMDSVTSEFYGTSEAEVSSDSPSFEIIKPSEAPPDDKS